MKTIQKFKDLILFVGIIAVLFIVIFRGPSEPIYIEPEVHDIETRILEKDTVIYHTETRLIQENKLIKELSLSLDSLKVQLNDFKQVKDTFMIVQIQDTIINTLTTENTHLKNVVLGQDSIITAQRYIIDSKDTIISIGNRDLKEVKRQRNISMLINGGLGALILLKN